MRLLTLLLWSLSLSAVETRVYPVISYRVLDGDSVEVMLDLGFDLTKKSVVRLVGINAPEVRGVERDLGLSVKGLVEAKLSEGQITCQWLADDKYGGRFVGRLLVGEEDLSVYLLSTGKVKEYDGKAVKPTFKEKQ